MNIELIRLARKAAKEFAGPEGYSQAGQLINALCDELEAVPEQPLMPKEKAYRIVAECIYSARQKYMGAKVMVILADDIREAEQLAMTAFDTSSVFVRRVTPTADPQVYEV